VFCKQFTFALANRAALVLEFGPRIALRSAFRERCPVQGASSWPAAAPWYKVLYIQVIIAIVIGIAVGYFFPETGVSLKRLDDGFIQLIKMMIALVMFCTVVHGIASMSDLKKVGASA